MAMYLYMRDMGGVSPRRSTTFQSMPANHLHTVNERSTKCSSRYALVVLHIVGTVLKIAQTASAVPCQQLANEIACIGVHKGREIEATRQDLLVDPKGRVVKERRIPMTRRRL